MLFALQFISKLH